jgi:hypothetical protein
MLTIHAVAASDPVLVGRLRMHRSGRVKGRPALSCDVWCPYCKGPGHEFEWPDPPFPLDAAISFDAPCRTGSFAWGKIMIGLDPGRACEHNLLILDHTQALRRWRVEVRLRRSLAEARALDRRHLADGWDVVIRDGP